MGTGDGPEIKANVGIFEPTIKTIKEIEELNLVPEEIKEFLINKETKIARDIYKGEI